jgi:hypothetical protein
MQNLRWCILPNAWRIRFRCDSLISSIPAVGRASNDPFHPARHGPSVTQTELKMETVYDNPVCTENLIQVDVAMESPKLAG